MQSLKNSAGKTICKIDSKNKRFEISHKGIKTMVTFLINGHIEVKNISSK